MRAALQNQLRVISLDSIKALDQRIEPIWFDQKFVSNQLKKHDNFEQNLIGLIRRAARILSLRHAAKASSQISIRHADLAKALWFIFYAELCNVVAARLVIKKLRSDLSGKRIFVTLHKTELTAFQEWNDSSDLLPLYHYVELEKQGLQPTLITPSGSPVQQISIVLNKNIISSVVLIIGNEIFCPKATRGTEKILNLLQQRSKPGAKLQRFLFSGAEFESKATSIQLCAPKNHGEIKELNHHFSSKPIGFYVDELSNELFNYFYNRSAVLDQLVKTFDITRANICDHLFPDTALIAGSVAKNNGRLILWPHSTVNKLGAHLTDPPFESNRIFADDETQRLKKAGTKINLMPELMLKPPKSFQRVQLDSKLNIIIIAGAHCLNQTPLFSIRHHVSTIKRFLQGLSERSSRVNLFIRPKGHWETLSWFQSFTTDTLVAVDKPPSELDLSNMLFVCISHSSSALIEGVSKGVPGITVRETETFDYLKLEEHFFPRNNVTSALALIDSFSDLTKLENFWCNQKLWFDKHTEF